MTKKHPWLYLPIEIKARELDAKVLLSLIAAKNGFGIIFGGQIPLQRFLHKSLSGGIYLDKSISSNKKSDIQKVKRNGIRLTCFDEEGLLQSRENTDRAKRYASRRLSTENLAKTEIFFCWGENQAGIIEDHYPEFKDRLRCTGGPRIDLARPELKSLYDVRMKSFHEKYKPYIFIPSTFSSYINANSPDFVVEQIKRYDNLSGNKPNHEEYAFYERKIDFVRQNFEYFKEAILHLTKKYKDYNFVLRPHPQDDFKVWDDLAKNIDNLHVVFEGSAVQWIATCEVMIHNNCTTGIEGIVMEQPVIHYTPVASEEQDRNISGAETIKVTSLDALDSALEGILQKKSSPNKNAKEALSYYISSIDGAFASEKMIEELVLLNPKPKILPLQFLSARLVFINFLHSIKNILLFIKDTLFTKQVGERLTQTVDKQKFSGLKKSELIDLYKEIQTALHDETSLYVEQISKDLFYVRKAD